jgi:hypothetical protein
MSKPNSAIDNRVAVALGVYVGIAVLALVTLISVFPVVRGLSVPVPPAPTRQFIDISKVDKVYTVLVPD